ncbi:hypothetical protein [Sporosarcina koreensis]|uniref:hypothetical protein n=1 Tax=Sporosarcina koreensis TaxID=334735 RepID=UPI0015CF6A16|nr:hypothetical protein [Sporosarcina koreensis]
MTIKKIKLGKNTMSELVFKVAGILQSAEFNKEILQAHTAIEQLRVINKYS